jgi:hypothetical protein
LGDRNVPPARVAAGSLIRVAEARSSSVRDFFVNKFSDEERASRFRCANSKTRDVSERVGKSGE